MSEKERPVGTGGGGGSSVAIVAIVVLLILVVLVFFVFARPGGPIISVPGTIDINIKVPTSLPPPPQPTAAPKPLSWLELPLLLITYA